MIKIAKYAFSNKEQVETKIQGLGVAEDEDGNEYPTHKHTIVLLWVGYSFPSSSVAVPKASILLCACSLESNLYLLILITYLF